MKKLLVFLLGLLMIASAALAEFNIAALREDPDFYMRDIPGSVDTLYCSMNPPYQGELNEGYDGELVVYMDYMTLVDAEATVPRLMVSTVAYDQALNADRLRMTVGGKTYTFVVTHVESEYDGVYMEDYTTLLVGEGLNMLKAIAQQKKDNPIPVELQCLGETVFAGQVVLPGEAAADRYDRWIDLGGKQQNLKPLEELWPCEKK
ncbi:MAG: hypothetical protein IJB81_00150 [Clostridia bacterium]|nr:hypothetical protein [Clostridia bacterium]